MSAPRSSGEPARRTIGRYLLEEEIAAGGMATVHIGRMTGGGGFARTVAIKRLHAHIAKNPDLRSMLLDEARIVSRVHHTHVVQTLDLVIADGEVLLVMEYVHGEALHRLARTTTKAGRRIPPALVVTILAQALYGLHAAHEATDERGQSLEVVHRDVSPQNILVGADGVTRVLDFGVAKARGRLQSTEDGVLKGKLSYMPPEQFRGAPVDRRADIYSASVVLWEMLVGRELWSGPNEAATIGRILAGGAPPPSTLVPSLPSALDGIVLRGLSSQASARFPTALEMAEALHRVGFATAGEIAAFVREAAADSLERRASLIRSIERPATTDAAPPQATAQLGSTPPSLLTTTPLPPSAPLPSRPQLVTLPLVREGSAPAQALDASSPTAAPASMATSHTVRRSAPGTTSAQRVVVAAAAVLLVGAALLGWFVGRGDPANDPVPASASVLAPPLAPASSTTSISSSAAPSSSSAAPPVAPASSTTSISSSAVPSTSSTTATTSAISAKPRKSGVSCTPPYTVDADGIRTPKPECL